jgi:hypothetical protein
MWSVVGCTFVRGGERAEQRKSGGKGRGKRNKNKRQRRCVLKERRRCVFDGFFAPRVC